MASKNIIGRVQYMKGQLPYLYEERRKLEDQHEVLKKELANAQMKDKEHAKTKNYNSNSYKWALVIAELEQKDLEIADKVGEIDQEIAKAEATISGSNVSYNASQIYTYKNKKPAALSVKNVALPLAPASSLATSSSSSYAPAQAIDPGAISSASGPTLGVSNSILSTTSEYTIGDPISLVSARAGTPIEYISGISRATSLGPHNSLKSIPENANNSNNSQIGGKKKTRRRKNIKGSRKRRHSRN